MKRYTTLALPVAVALLALPAVVPPVAQADVTSCVIPSMTIGPIQGPEGGMEAVQNDLYDTDPDDSLLGDPLTDTDDGTQAEDGMYQLNNGGAFVDATCLAVDDPGEPTDDTGLYSAIIYSSGTYDNIICGTGVFTSDDDGDPGGEGTTIDLTPVAAAGPGEDVYDADYGYQFIAGVGPIVFDSVDSSGDEGDEDGEHGSGAGTFAMHATYAGNCITTDVTAMNGSGAFTFVTD